MSRSPSPLLSFHMPLYPFCSISFTSPVTKCPITVQGTALNHFRYRVVFLLVYKGSNYSATPVTHTNLSDKLDFFFCLVSFRNSNYLLSQSTLTVSLLNQRLGQGKPGKPSLGGFPVPSVFFSFYSHGFTSRRFALLPPRA